MMATDAAGDESILVSNEEERDGNHALSSSCPPRFGDGNTEPGGHVQCYCCPGVRVSYCMLSQVCVCARKRHIWEG